MDLDPENQPTTHSFDPVREAASSGMSAYILERYRRTEAGEQLRATRLERDKCLASLNRILSELESIEETMHTTHAVASECERLRNTCSRQAEVLRDLASCALTFATDVQERMRVVNLCQSVGFIPGTTLKVRSLLGLPRFKIFAEEVCMVTITVLNFEESVLWKSSPIPINRDRGTDGNCVAEIPLCFFTDVSEVCVGIVFDSHVVAKSVLLDRHLLASSSLLQLYHNDIPIEKCFISLENSDPPPLPEIIRAILRIVVLSISDIILDEGLEGNITLSLIPEVVGADRRLDIDLNPESSSMEAELEIDPLICFQATVAVRAASFTVCTGRFIVDPDQAIEDEIKVNVELFDSEGNPNGSVEFSLEVLRASSGTVGARSG